ncbi:hypothetical protein AB685_00305 [Bacillus sp. LL01]|uniref:hypothetical protein n=1 Tax=Bacillus sp. LL01 TaxID=1665556 RepID=UPI00064D39E5|nr:hypothetical protein [Bacillus sp. LL01]KMJ59369.1 hypothetical protein AB685_00305 [Bacillus sp. LL01]
MGNLWRNSIHLLLELNILYFFILLMYLDSGNLPSIVGILLPYGFAIAIFGYLYDKLPNSYVAIMLVAPVLAVFPYLSSYSLGLSIIIGFFISFRAFMYFIEERAFSSFALLIISFIWMPFVYGAGILVDYPHGMILMTFFGGQLALVILLYSGTAILNLNGNRYMQKRVVGATAITFVSIIAASAIFATLGKFIVTTGLSLFGQGISVIFDLLARPLFFLMGLHDWSINSQGSLDEGTVEMGEENEEETAELLAPSESLLDNPIAIALGVILFLTILYFLLKRKKVTKKQRELPSEQQFTSTMTKMGGGFFSGSRKQKPPEDEVRRLMFDLEQLAIKKKRGRLPNETLEEWLQRETTFNESFMELYAKVRYGEMKLTDKEVENCRVMAEEIRKVMKQWKKAS